MNIKFEDRGIHNVNNIPQWFFDEITDLPTVAYKRGNPGYSNRPEYKSCITAFDIETTRLHDYTPEQLQEARKDKKNLPDETVMYIWQWCFTWNIETSDDTKTYREVVIYGRTWTEFKEFIERLKDTKWPNDRFIVYDHNLAYEFQFLRSVLPFSPDNVFNMKSRQPVKAYTSGLEFRCSLKQSNMSLAKLAEQMQTPHQKTTMEYKTKRYSYTQLTADELTYAVNDVYALAEAMVIRMENEGDTLTTIPLTSTGYVRREVKRAVSSKPYTLKKIRNMAPSYEIYEELKEAFRGGNTHANRYFSNELIKDEVIHSADRSSSYPAVICNREYPMTTFEAVINSSVENVIHYMNDLHRAILARVKFSNITLADKYWGCPYLSMSKCRDIKNGQYDNGRVLSADYLETTVTDVDLRIIFEEYIMDGIEFYDVYSAKYAKIPKEIIEKVIEYYQKKTSLKGLEDMVYYYLKSKNLLNSVYGMMVMDLVKLLVTYEDGNKQGVTGHFETGDADKREILEKTEKKGFLNYAWGVWVTAWARYELERGIRLVDDTKGAEFIYCDTDSVKYLGDVDWTAYNAERIAEAMQSGSHATDPAGVEHYMGVFEAEHDMSEFITMGAKKYAFIDAKTGEMTITIAGVGKKTGAEYLKIKAKEDGLNDPLEEFHEGFVFKEFVDDKGKTQEPGGLEPVYNDHPYSQTIPLVMNEEGQYVELTSNITLRPSTYELGLTAEYRDLLEGIDYTNGDDLT